jgi:hypothetical protein
LCYNQKTSQRLQHDDFEKTFVRRTRCRVEVMFPAEVKFWSRELGCSEWKLLDAVALVGANVDDLRRHLRSQRRASEPATR